MAGFPLTGVLASGAVTGTSQLKQLLETALKNVRFNLAQGSEQYEISQLGGSAVARERVQGLENTTFEFEGHYPKTSPRLGNSGLITYATGFVEYVTRWSLAVDFGEIELTAMTGTALTARGYVPSGLIDWSGSYTAHAVSGNRIKATSPANDIGAAATFKITADTTTDPAFTGNIITSQVGQAIRKGDLQECSYGFVGANDLSEVLGGTLPYLLVSGGGVVQPSVLETGSADGTPDVSLTVTTHTGRTVVGNAFLKSFNIEVTPGEPIRVTGTARFTGPVTRN